MFDCTPTLWYIYYMNNEEAYNHGYNGTLTLDELHGILTPCGLRDEEPSQISAFQSGVEDRAHDQQDREGDTMTDGEADGDALASAGWGMDEDYGGDSEWI